jgi:hypothetical protein
LYSAQGEILMGKGTRVDSWGGNILLQAGSMTLATVNARSADLSIKGEVEINAADGAGTVTDANQNSSPDVFAKTIHLMAYGPASDGSGDVLEAVTDAVQISVTAGLVVWDSGADGRTYFNVMLDGKLYQQLVVEGAVVLETEDAARLLFDGMATDSQGLSGVQDGNLLAGAEGSTSRLHQSYILGTPGEQPFIAGLDSFSLDSFEYWVETLSL